MAEEALRRWLSGRKLIVVEATRDEHAPGGWRLDYGFQSETPNVAANTAATALDGDVLRFAIPVESPANARPGIKGQLRIEMRQWQ